MVNDLDQSRDDFPSANPLTGPVNHGVLIHEMKGNRIYMYM